VAQEELFVFPLQVEDLEDAGAGFFDGFGAESAFLRIGRDAGDGGILERGKAGFQTGEEIAAFVEQGGVGGALVLLKKAVFLDGQMMELFAKLQVCGKRFRRNHGEGGVAGAGGAAVMAGTGGAKKAETW